MTKDISELVKKLQLSLPYFKRINDIGIQQKAIKEQLGRDPYQAARITLGTLEIVLGGIFYGFIFLLFDKAVFSDVKMTAEIAFSMAFIKGYILSTVPMVFIWVLLAWGRRRKKRKLARHLELLNREMESIIREHGDLLCVLPKGYRYYIAVDYIQQIFRNGRADTLKEALNLYEEQLHRWKMENGQQQLIRVAEQQKIALDAVNMNTTISAVTDLLSFR